MYSLKTARVCSGINRVNHRTPTRRISASSSLCVAQMAKKAVEELDGVDEANVEVVFEPPWNPEMMSAEARKKLGFE